MPRSRPSNVAAPSRHSPALTQPLWSRQDPPNSCIGSRRHSMTAGNTQALKTQALTTKALLPVRLPRLGATLARGIRAGRWVFATGLNAAVPGVGLPPSVTGGRNPLYGEPPGKREARPLVANSREGRAAARPRVPARPST